jgi:hypothetical protein
VQEADCGTDGRTLSGIARDRTDHRAAGGANRRGGDHSGVDARVVLGPDVTVTIVTLLLLCALPLRLVDDRLLRMRRTGSQQCCHRSDGNAGDLPHDRSFDVSRLRIA